METHYEFTKRRVRKDGTVSEVQCTKFKKTDSVIRQMIRAMSPHELNELFPHVKEIYDREPRNEKPKKLRKKKEEPTPVPLAKIHQSFEDQIEREEKARLAKREEQ